MPEMAFIEAFISIRVFLLESKYRRIIADLKAFLRVLKARYAAVGQLNIPFLEPLILPLSSSVMGAIMREYPAINFL
jgi:hypothetical protein